MLPTPRDADDRDTQEQAKEHVHEASPQSPENQPEQIQWDANATCRAIRFSYCRTKRP